jgi:hypothetical protein
VSMVEQALAQFVAESRNNPLGEDESRAIVRRVLGIPGERAVNRLTDARRRLTMLALLNVSNECLQRHRAQLGPNAHAVLGAVQELSRTRLRPAGTALSLGKDCQGSAPCQRP